MNAERLLALYEKIADAPDAVARLRRFILDLAVRGKLVPQDASDEPAAELLKRIAREKARLVETGEIRTPKAASPLANLPFAVPSNWRWSQLAEIGLLSPRNDAPDTCEASFVPMPLISAEYGIANQHEVRTWGEIKKGYTHFAEGDVGLAKITPCFENGKSTIFQKLTGGIGAGTTELHIVRPLFVDPKYVLIFLKSPYFIETGIPKMTGTAGQKRVPTEYFSSSPFPLPPLDEQHRIVAKIDELMRLCDRLEAARAGREAVRDRLAAASLARLGAPDHETFQADARYILDALPTLTARADQIKALRQTILNLAVRGKLVPQDASDEPATELAKRIAKKRADLLKAGYPNPDEARAQIKKLAEQSMPDSLDVLPEGWIWSTLLSCSALVVDCKNKTAPNARSGIRLIRTTNVRDGKMNNNEQKFVDQKTYETWSARCTPEPGDILITREAPMGEVCLIPPGEQVCLGQRMMLARLVENTINKDFMIFSLRDPKLMDRVQDKPIGATVQHLRVGGVESLLIPLPPLAEQQRIVAKVDTLMSLCDRLETALAAAASARARLLDAVLAEALAPADDSSGPMVEPTTAAASPRATITTERSAFVLSLAYERHRAARRERTFGHVKAEKILHLVEAEAGLDLGRVPIRIAAGPADFPRLLSVDEWARQHRRFDFGQKGKGYTFEPLAEFQRSLQMAETIDAPTRARIEAIIDTFVPIDTEAAELFATVYTAWNNLLIEGKRPKDDDILRAAREDWHPKKLQIAREKFAVALQRVKASAFVPSGRGKFVPPAPQRDLFSKQ